MSLCGADDVAAAAEYIAKEREFLEVFLYGSSSGALRGGFFAQAPSRARAAAVAPMRWCGPAKAAPTLADAANACRSFRASNRRPIDRDFVRSIFTRDHPGRAT